MFYLNSSLSNLHEEFEECEFGKIFERVMGMFRHEVEDGIDEINEEPEEAIKDNSDDNEYVVTI